MRLTGADISSDTGCRQAAAFDNARSCRAVWSVGSSRVSACVSAANAVDAGCDKQTSLYSDSFQIPRSDSKSRQRCWRPSIGLSEMVVQVSNEQAEGFKFN